MSRATVLMCEETIAQKSGKTRLQPALFDLCFSAYHHGYIIDVPLAKGLLQGMWVASTLLSFFLLGHLLVLWFPAADRLFVSVRRLPSMRWALIPCCGKQEIHLQVSMLKHMSSTQACQWRLSAV